MILGNYMGKGSLHPIFVIIGIRKPVASANVSMVVGVTDWILGWESVQLVVVLIRVC